MQRLNEDEMFDLFEAKSFKKVAAFVKKYGVNAVDRDRRNLLTNFIIEHRTDFALLLVEGYNDLDVNQQDKEGWSALHFAAKEDDILVLKLLIKNKASVDIVDKHGNTPLWRALFENASEKLVLQLLKSKASVTTKNTHGVSPKSLVEKSMTKVTAWLKKRK